MVIIVLVDHVLEEGAQADLPTVSLLDAPQPPSAISDVRIADPKNRMLTRSCRCIQAASENSGDPHLPTFLGSRFRPLASKIHKNNPPLAEFHYRIYSPAN